MKSTNWRAIAESIGISAIVASLVFVGFQLQQDRRVASSEVNMAALEAKVAVDTAISEHADLWVKARDMQDLSEAEILILDRLVTMAADRAFLGALASLRIRIGENSSDFERAPGQVMAFVILLHENAGVQKIWAEAADRQEKYYEKTVANKSRTDFNTVVRDFLMQLQN